MQGHLSVTQRRGAIEICNRSWTGIGRAVLSGAPHTDLVAAGLDHSTGEAMHGGRKLARSGGSTGATVAAALMPSRPAARAGRVQPDQSQATSRAVSLGLGPTSLRSARRASPA